MASIILSEASEKLTSLYGELQAPIASIITDRLEAFEQESIAKLVFAERKSTHSIESYGSLTAIDAFAPVGENGAYPSGGFEDGYFKTLRNMTWKGSMAISREMVDDSSIADLRKKPIGFIKDYGRKYERFYAALLGAALLGKTSFIQNGMTFDATSADGVCLFSKAHKPKVSGANISNVYADAFSTAALAGIMTAMQNCKDDNGNTLALVPDTIIIPNLPTLKTEVLKVIGSELDPNTPNNALNSQYGNWRVLVWPYLNDFIKAGTAPYIIMDSSYNDVADCAIRQNRVDLEVRDELGASDEYLWKGYARFTGGFADFRGMFAGGIAGGTAV